MTFLVEDHYINLDQFSVDANYIIALRRPRLLLSECLRRKQKQAEASQNDGWRRNAAANFIHGSLVAVQSELVLGEQLE
jgi:hypothetical protein